MDTRWLATRRRQRGVSRNPVSPVRAVARTGDERLARRPAFCLPGSRCACRRRRRRSRQASRHARAGVPLHHGRADRTGRRHARARRTRHLDRAPPRRGGVGGIAIGFGAQSLVKDCFNFFLQGDVVEVPGKSDSPTPASSSAAASRRCHSSSGTCAAHNWHRDSVSASDALSRPGQGRTRARARACASKPTRLHAERLRSSVSRTVECPCRLRTRSAAQRQGVEPGGTADRSDGGRRRARGLAPTEMLFSTAEGAAIR